MYASMTPLLMTLLQLNFWQVTSVVTIRVLIYALVRIQLPVVDFSLYIHIGPSISLLTRQKHRCWVKFSTQVLISNLKVMHLEVLR